MSSELDRMKRAFGRQDAIRPDENARKAAIQAAMSQFDEEFSSARQGLAGDDRPRKRNSTLLNAFNWRRLMTIPHPNRTQWLAGGASIAVLALAIVSVDQIRPDLFPSERQSTVETEITQLAASADESDQAAREQIETAFHESAPVAESVVAQDHAAGGAVSTMSAERRLRAPASQSKALTGVAASQPLADRPAPSGYQDQGRDKFADITPNQVKRVTEAPVSTFSVDVDTASYSFLRSALNRGVLPQTDALRIEEMINYFDYDYAPPVNAEEPFKAQVTIMPSPWNDNNKLLSIGIKGYELPKAEAPPANLVFLIDTSGSMDAPDKLPLLRNAFRLLLSTLKPQDTVAIVAYAGGAGTVLEPTKVADRNTILTALENLDAGGSTAGAEGIRLAYQLAEQQMAKDGVNRVMLATDGDFNVGITDTDELTDFVERKRRSGVSLSVLGFGRGNYNDELMQSLAQNGNGNAAYIDTLSEARKVLVEEAGSTLFTIAKDVKLQLEFNPATVSEYRLIGYETRILNREDFNNDKIDAGDIGAGHTVTALYEFTPAGAPGQLIDDLRYGNADTPSAEPGNDEYAFLKIRYKLPDSDTSRLISVPVTKDRETAEIAGAPQEARFAAAVAGFGQLLRGGRHTGQYSYEDVIALAQSAKGEDRFGYRAEFINLVRLAQSAAALEPLDQ
ncbi:MAG: VWA domain-containing protein [Alphaproteobacteria bacterium]|nr:VWA domain-containing protein [Alphaproteobacteria bacterium]